MKVAFTGHRPEKIGGYDLSNPVAKQVKMAISKKLQELGTIERAISGLALGVDQIAAEVCIALKIPFVAAIPFVGQESKWPLKAQEHYEYLLSCAEKAQCVSSGEYAAWKMQARNQWMVDDCDVLIAVYDGSPGGTRNCVEYAQKQGKTIHFIDPKQFVEKREVYSRPGYL